MKPTFIRPFSIIICLLLLTSCERVSTRVVDNVEIRVFASSSSVIRDTTFKDAIADSFIQIISTVVETEHVSDADVHPGKSSFMRVALLADEGDGKQKFARGLLLFGPNEDNFVAAPVIYFQSLSNQHWYRAELEPKIVAEMLHMIEARTSQELDSVIEMNFAQLDAARRAITSLLLVMNDPAIFENSVLFISVEDQIWPSSALGYPVEGMVYAQALVPGHAVVLRLPDGSTVECHTSINNVALPPSLSR
ncbi:MAG: hypothetical protein JKX97_05225 [Candidatus Lindowbacteria bacterium]|nr:hypothetical protein [Candidatus Lindowbacteria bacterium]